MRKNHYLAMKTAHQKEWDAFPMFFAFNEQQFAEGMKKLGLAPHQTEMLCALGRTGGYIRKSDREKLQEMMDRQCREKEEAIASDLSGEGFIREMFSYELSNHEYCYTEDLTDTLSALGLSEEQINNNDALRHGLALAISEQISEE